MGFQLVPKSVILNDLERLMAIILRYFAELGRFHGQFRTSGWLAVDLLFVSPCHKHDGRDVLFAIAELLVSFLWLCNIKLFNNDTWVFNGVTLR